MATVAEKVQGVSGEGHQKVKNDHEQFLEAYENPTLIYKFLQARNSVKPLYLQRNLSYMPHRARRSQRRYKRKFSKGSKLPSLGLQPNRKVDLVSETKSDTRLEISFCCLEKGLDHSELLDARVNHDTEAQATGKNEADPPEQKPEIAHGALMEVEVLLFRFKQSNICLSGEPCPCHCSSLGKKTLEYRSNFSVDAKESVNAPALTLSIPESMFTWKANSGGGTQMLVFKASYVPKPVAKKAPVPIHLINFVSRKGCRKNMALSVNRLSLSEISQTKVGGIAGKTLVQSSSGCLSIEKKDNENEEMGETRIASLGNAVLENNVGCDEAKYEALEMQVSSSLSSGHHQLSASGKTAAVPKTRTNTPKNHFLSAKKLAKSSSKPKKASKDVSIMTDISFGTGMIQDPTILCQAPSSLPSAPHYQHLHDHQYTSSYSSSQSFTAALEDSSLSSHSNSTRKGYADKCTSPKLTFKNGTLNGLNGYVLPEVTAIRAGTDIAVNCLSKPSNEQIPASLPVAPCVAVKKKKKKRKRKFSIKAKEKKHHKRLKYHIGSGKKGQRSFLVSLPRVHFDRIHQQNSSKTANDSHYLDGSYVPRLAQTKTGSFSQRSRRRTQVELLQDHFNSIGQKDSSDLDNPPPSSSEEVSNHLPSPLTSSSKWLCSSTRKITPVNLFNFPSLSPSRKSGGLLSGWHGSTRLSSTGNSTTTRKRSQSSPEMSSSVDKLDNSFLPQNASKTVESFPPLLEKRGGGFSEMAIPSKFKLPELNNKIPYEVTDQKCPEPQMEVVIEARGMDREGESLEEDQHSQVMSGLEGSSKKEQDMLKTLEGVYSGEIVVFDSRGECLVKDGQYSILLQKEGEENNSTFEPLTWTTILGNQNCSKNSENSSVNLLLKFSVAWSRGPPQHRLCSKMRTAVDLQQIRNEYFESLPPSVVPTPTPLVAPEDVSSSNLPLSFPPPLQIVEDFTGLIPSPAVSKLVRDTLMEGCPAAMQSFPCLQDKVPPDEEESESVLHSPPMNPLLGQPTHWQPKVIFNYLYSENGLQKTESQAGMVCPWCCLSCGKIYALLKHMSVCHPRFHFTYSMGSEGDHIVDVHVNKMYDMTSSSMDRDPGEWNNIALARRKNGPSKCLSCTAVFVDGHVVVKEDLSEFLNDGSWRRGYNVNRVYHHCRTCLPLLQDEVEQEKEEKKKALQWQQISSEKMIDEFTDVNKGEKELITLWNAFVMGKRFIAEKQVPLVCFKFAQELGPTLVKKGLVPNFMAHLVNLIEYGQISPTTLKNCMKTVRDLKTGVS